jgi:hypothetical protein
VDQSHSVTEPAEVIMCRRSWFIGEIRKPMIVSEALGSKMRNRREVATE